MRTLSFVTAIVAAGALALTGCSSGGSPEASGASTGPLEVGTGQGVVSVPADPQRIVALHSAAADVAVALGSTPVAVAGNSVSGSDEVYPWETDVLGEVTDASLLDAQTFAVNVEKVAEYDPDLILAASWNVTDPVVYDQLSAIAPVITPDSDVANPDWDVMAKTVGTALGQDTEVDELIATTKQDLQATGAKFGVQGKTYQLVSPRADGVYFGNAKPLELYGLEPGRHQTPEEVNSFALSPEELSRLDADYLFIWPMDDEAKKTIEDNPAFDSLPAVRNGTMTFIDANTAAAINAASPASLDWLNANSAITDLLGG